ncbi:MAG: hypothetical protein IPK64_19125 [bacterium]|nr:hypothetical protein [bacterium]
MRSCFLILGLAFSALTAAGGALAAAPWQVVLTDGTRLEGVLVRTEPASYLLQTDSVLYELTDDDIDPRTFSGRPAREAEPARPVYDLRHFDEIHADGSVTSWWVRHNVNDSNRVITEYRVGLGPWERTVIDQRAWRDGYGNPLTPVFDPPRERWAALDEESVSVTMKLPVPVAPGEAWTIVGRETSLGTEQLDGRFFYVRSGNYADDNLVWRKVRLPLGARIESATPTPTARFEQDGFQYVIWRRLYTKLEEYPLRIVYSMP